MIETKQVEIGYPNSEVDYFRQIHEEGIKYVEDLIAFGWQKTQTAEQRHGRTTSNYQILARETSIPNYEQLKALEERYESAKAAIKYYEKASFSTALLLLLLLIVPGVLYIVYKTNKKNSIKANNLQQKETMKQCVADARKILTNAQ